MTRYGVVLSCMRRIWSGKHKELENFEYGPPALKKKDPGSIFFSLDFGYAKYQFLEFYLVVLISDPRCRAQWLSTFRRIAQ